MNLLVTTPEHDDTTHYISKWSYKEIANADGVIILNLHQEKANRKELEGRLIKKKHKIVIFNGHGSSNTICGHKDKELIILNQNEQYLANTIIYSISCSSAINLGPSCVKKGAKSFIGYKDDFIFFYDKDMISRPLKDKTAKLFLEPSNELIRKLLKGHSPKEACVHSKELYKKNISKLLSSNSSKDDLNMARYLWWDMKNLICIE